MTADAARPPLAARPYEGWRPDVRLLALPGLEHVRWGGPERREPIGALLAMSAPVLEEGAATFTMPCTGWLVGASGRVQPGVLAVLADAANAAAVASTLPPRHLLQTLDLALDFVAAPALDAGELRCEARVLDSGDGALGVLSAATIDDASGRRVAHARARSDVHALPEGPHEPPPESALRELERVPRPAAGPVAGAPLPPGLLAQAEPLALLRGLAAGDPALPPIHHLTGLRPVAAERGEVTVAVPASDWLASFAGNVHGGVLGMLLEAATAGAVWTMLPAGHDVLPGALKVTYVRPALAQGGEVEARGRVVRCGRRVAVATAEATSADGRTVAVATATHLVAQDAS